MLKSVTKSHPLQLLLQARAICVGALKVLGNQFARAALVAVLVVPAVAHADVAVPGEDASEYQAAVQLWLDGSDDLKALRQLSGLANQENTAAQILLASIARTEHTHVAVTQSLQRRERIALLREDVGLSGRDWLQRASETSPLAQALWSYISPAVGRGYDLDAVDILLYHGEIRHGFRALNNLAAQSPGFEIALFIYEHQEELGAGSLSILDYVLRSEVAEGATVIPVPRTGMSEDDLSQFLSGLSNPQNRFAQLGLLEFIEGPDSYSVSEATILEWVRDDPGLPPLMTFCSSECSNAVDACLISGARALTFSSGFPHPLASPSQSLVPDQVYWGSGRFVRDLTSLLNAGQWEGCR
ncbi:hypothetical protein [Pontivivens nitratireducens]|uniref:hypothetical protein n=1 Tax=Pontivivens nitratireducens TaxID=2758038 RepID=UPI0016398DD8|nr:hypothetical protein [Pontibrevibacter nitratireducens]